MHKVNAVSPRLALPRKESWLLPPLCGDKRLRERKVNRLAQHYRREMHLPFLSFRQPPPWLTPCPFAVSRSCCGIRLALADGGSLPFSLLPPLAALESQTPRGRSSAAGGSLRFNSVRYSAFRIPDSALLCAAGAFAFSRSRRSIRRRLLRMYLSGTASR